MRIGSVELPSPYAIAPMAGMKYSEKKICAWRAYSGSNWNDAPGT